MKKKPPLDTFATRLDRLRIEAGLNVFALAKLAGLPRQTVWRYLEGVREPTLENAVRLARALAVPVETFAEVVPPVEK